MAQKKQEPKYLQRGGSLPGGNLLVPATPNLAMCNWTFMIN
jgi:hypothetical protein